MPEGPSELASPSPAPFADRLAAYLLDLAVGLGGAIGSIVAAWLWLLWRSDGGNREPGATAIYLAIIAGTIWMPVWAACTAVCWSRSGQTPGMAAMALRVTEPDGGPPGPMRSLSRVLLLTVGTLSALLAPLFLIAATAAATQGTLPPFAGLATLLLLLIAIAGPICCKVTRERRALHDLIAGTRVVRA